jgi:hypothetical protein
MLSSILTTLQSLISPSFVVASFFPMLTFWLLNAAMFYWSSEMFRNLIGRVWTAGTGIQNSIWAAGFLLATAMTAYVLSALIPTLQAWMEGKWQCDEMVHLFAPAEGRRLEKIDDQISEVARYRTMLARKAKIWLEILQRAAESGQTNHRGHNAFMPWHPAALAVRNLVDLGQANRRIDLRELEQAVAMLGVALTQNDYDTPLPNGRWVLDETFGKLSRLLRVAQAREETNHMRLQTERHFSFGTQNLAPTKMGNIANTIQSFAVNRYNMNLEVFWSRLQHTVASDKDFSAKLEAVRTKLEFLIGCSTLTASWAAIWAVILLAWGNEWIAFVCVALGGPLIAYAWYRVATEHYKAYADVLRTSVDLFRFGLLRDFHLSLPADVVAERTLWDQLNQLTAYYDVNNFRFEHPKS